MIKIILLTIGLAVRIFCLAQSEALIVLEGNLRSEGQVVTFANVGVMGKNVGTISDGSGRFHLEVPRSLLGQNLTISYVGYETLHLPLDSLVGVEKCVIELTEEVQLLDAVVVTAEGLKGKTKDYGCKRAHDAFVWIQEGEVGSEIVRLIDPEEVVFLNAISVQILNMEKKEFTLLLNIYDADTVTGRPGSQLLKRPRIVRDSQKKGWLTVAIDDQGIVLDHPFYVGFQWVEIDVATPLIGAVARTSQESLWRAQALGIWKEEYSWDIRATCTTYSEKAP